MNGRIDQNLEPGSVEILMGIYFQSCHSYLVEKKLKRSDDLDPYKGKEKGTWIEDTALTINEIRIRKRTGQRLINLGRYQISNY